MPSRQLFAKHLFGGGWSTDFGPSVDVTVDQSGMVTLPFLVDAEDVLFELDGGPHLAPGTTKLSSQLESGAVVKGLYDFWITGTTGNPSQHRVCHVGTKIKKDDGDGSFTDLFTGMTSGAVPSYAQLEDVLAMANGVDHMKSWDGTTAANLAGSPPTGAWVTRYRNKLFAGGDPANPSRLYYTVDLNPGDWAGDGSGFIDVEPDDGDGLTGAMSFKQQLVIFKGPNKGSIHVLSGSSPIGDDPYLLQPFVRGIGAAHQNSVFPFGDDIGWISPDGSVRSLSVTAAYGNFREGALSKPIRNWLNDHVNFSRLKHAWAAEWPSLGIVLFGLAIDGASDNNGILAMDYRFSPVRWSYLRSFGHTAGALALVVDATQNKRQLVMSGGTDGYVRKLGSTSRSIDGAMALAYKVTSPFLNYGLPQRMKTLVGGAVGLAPHNDGDVTFGWTRDDQAQQTQSLAQGGTAVLDSFVLDTDVLGGSRFVDRFFQLDEGGEFRSAQYQILGGAAGEDLEVHSFAIGLEVGGESYENDL